MFKPVIKQLGELGSDVNKLKTPQERINFRTYFILVIILGAIVYIFWNIITNESKEKIADLKGQITDLKKEIKDLQGDNKRLNYKVDSLVQRVYESEIIRYRDKTESVNKLKNLVKNQRKSLSK